MISLWILGGLAFLSSGLVLWQWMAARAFPLHLRRPTAHTPGVTVLKPLKGGDQETAANLTSWLEQKRPGRFQILFGVADPEDPVCDLVRELLAACPETDGRLVICPDRLGPNAKVSTLAQLQPLARHDLILVSDADVRVPTDFLPQVMAPFEEAEVGLVHCFYRLANPVTLAMHWEAVAVNADFWSQVLQSNTLKTTDFALGAVMVLRRRHLEAMGGFAALVDYLADDFQLGQHVFRQGGKIRLCTLAVECWEAPQDWKAVWNHQLRWARTIRVCQPAPYFFSILSNGSLWPMLLILTAAVSSGGAAGIPWIGFGGICLAVRVCTALSCERKMTEAPAPVWHALMVPLKDLLQSVVWALSFVGNRVIWRGQTFRVRRGGKLEKA